MRTDARRSAARAALTALVSAASAASACGLCIEDRVAAVYDQPAIEGAVARHQHVAFFGLNGSLPATPATRKAVAAALESAGVRGSARVSIESATASVAFDPARPSPPALAAAADRALASRAITLESLRVIEGDGELRVPR